MTPQDPWFDEPPPELDELPPDPEDERRALAERAANPRPAERPTSPRRSPKPDAKAVQHSGAGLRAEALEILRALTGRADAEFHPGQFEAIEALVADHRRALVVQRMELVGIEVDAAFLVAHKGIVLPAVPQAHDHVMELGRTVVAVAMRILGAAVEVQGLGRGGRSHQVPAR